MSEPDHFSTILDVEAHEQLHDHSGDESEYADGYADSHEQEAEPRKKKSLPTPVLIVGGMVAFIALGAGYQHFFGAKPQTGIAPPPAIASAETGGMIASNGEQQTPPLPSAARSGGFPNDAANAAPLPAGIRPVSTEPVDPIGPVPSVGNARVTAQPAAAAQLASTQAPMDMGVAAGTPNPGRASMIGNVAVAPSYASAAPGADNPSSAVSASDPAAPVGIPAATLIPAQAPDPKDAEITQLKAELKEAKAHHGATPRYAPRRLARTHRALPANDAASATASSTAAPAATSAAASSDAASGGSAPQVASTTRRVRHGVRGKHAPLGVLSGYRVKQVIPGQGWVEDEETGKQQVVSVGDRIGQAQVTKIDPDTYRIETTTGVIQ